MQHTTKQHTTMQHTTIKHTTIKNTTIQHITIRHTTIQHTTYNEITHNKTTYHDSICRLYANGSPEGPLSNRGSGRAELILRVNVLNFEKIGQKYMKIL